MAIYYYVPDNNNPSWGVGVIYNHVKALNEGREEAYIVHEKKGFTLSWLKVNVPVKYNDGKLLQTLTKDDILVVPEVAVNLHDLKRLKCTKVLFIQNVGYLFESMPEAETHKSLGFNYVFIIMPHQIQLVKRHIGLPYYLIPPCVSDAFFIENRKIRREKTILLYPKQYQIDYTIVKHLLLREIEKYNQCIGRNRKRDKWRIQELKGYKHKDIPILMQRSEVFVSLNTFEALNTSVVEAMASGCIVFTYEAIGPKDYLINGKNSFVYGNNEAYELVAGLIEFVGSYADRSVSISEMRDNARDTAGIYNRKRMEDDLFDALKELKNNRQNSV